MGKWKKTFEYALYQGDKFIDLGTIEEIAIRHGYEKETLRSYATPSRIRKNNGEGMIVIRIED